MCLADPMMVRGYYSLELGGVQGAGLGGRVAFYVSPLNLRE